MARYSSFLGRKVQVHYRASDTLLPASGTFVADSGRSIFLEQSFEQRGQHRHFRWEIPYTCLVRIALLNLDDATPLEIAGPLRGPQEGDSAEPAGRFESEPHPGPSSGKLASAAAAGAGLAAVVLPFRKHSQSA